MDSPIAGKIDRCVTFIGMAAGWLLFALTAVVCFDVITRKFFVFQSTFLQELEWHLHTVIFFLAIPMAYLRGIHVRIDILRDRMGDRGRAKLELIGLFLLAIPFTLFLLKYGIDFVAQSYAQNEGSTSMQGIHHRWIIKSIIPIAMLLTLLSLIATVIRGVLFLAGKGPVPEAFARKEIAAVAVEEIR
ncbi:TRAP transporter small permease subunit [Bordetella sp. 15P40C-2]|uniref:TRAP transporter small permease subunit n=1 Tax=Bordetella sp. 15P40C-2 TaxID=2572246 RepID=UPI001324D671|nr:TRAP transporter small permease subunit [Bordetella sp. 15P40C-2]MVW70343.1 TRAP transporter small permease subunit [Bordetella sp. 15P40C-2]